MIISNEDERLLRPNFFLLRISIARERMPSKIINNLATLPQKDLSALAWRD
jgi:hypothetical protein